MRLFEILSFITCVSLLVGCATPAQHTITLSPNLQLSDISITVSMTDIPTPTMTYPGAGCLLCLGIAATANSDLSTYAKTLSIDELTVLSNDVADILRADGVTVVLEKSASFLNGLKKSSSKTYNAARKDYRPLRAQLNTSHLLIIDFDYVGMSRNYANYIIKSDPYAKVSGVIYMVNLETNQYEWYLPLFSQNYSDGIWKEQPDYPGLSNAYYQSTSYVRDAVLTAIKKSIE